VTETKVVRQSAMLGAFVFFAFVGATGQPWPAAIDRMAFDLVDDGFAAFPLLTPAGGQPVRGFAFTPGVIGSFEFVMTARDVNGCDGQSKARRVVVTP
jgi:hypothetical protein